jgi:hypothetical protein
LPMMSRNQREEERMSNEETHNDIPKPFRLWHKWLHPLWGVWQNCRGPNEEMSVRCVTS